MNEARIYHQPCVLRVFQTKEQTRAFYNKIARIYDILAEHSEAPARKAGLKLLDVQQGQKILEIGFGTGHSLVELAKSVGPEGKVYGIDLSENMLEISKKRARRLKLEDRMELSCGDAVHLPYESETLDGVFMSFTLELFDTPDIIVVLSECKRVLKPGGKIVIVAMSRVRPRGFIMKTFEWTHKHFPSYLDCRPILVQKALEDAGFRICDNKIMKVWINVEIVCGRKVSGEIDMAEK